MPDGPGSECGGTTATRASTSECSPSSLNASKNDAQVSNPADRAMNVLMSARDNPALGLTASGNRLS